MKQFRKKSAGFIILFLIVLIFESSLFSSLAEELDYSSVITQACTQFEKQFSISAPEIGQISIGAHYFNSFPGKEFWQIDFNYGDENYLIYSVCINCSTKALTVLSAISDEIFTSYKRYDSLRYDIYEKVLSWETDQSLGPYPLWSYQKKAEFYDIYGYCGDITYLTQNKIAALPEDGDFSYEKVLDISNQVLISELKASDQNLAQLQIGSTFSYSEAIEESIWLIQYYRIVRQERKNAYTFECVYNVMISAKDGYCYLAERMVFLPGDSLELPIAYLGGELLYSEY